MNFNQTSYDAARIYNGHSDLIRVVSATAIALAASANLGPVLSLPLLGLSGELLYGAAKTALSRLHLSSLRFVQSETPDEHKDPLQSVEEIVIEDLDGLNHLLKRTSDKEKKEWGTILHLEEKSGTAYLKEILNSKRAEQENIVRERKRYGVLIDVPFARLIGHEVFNGNHHYHTDFLSYPQAINYSIHTIDRASKGLNLLTFNTAQGPEVIGYNLFDTFIPTDETKTKLVKATSKDIRDFLGRT